MRKIDFEEMQRILTGFNLDNNVLDTIKNSIFAEEDSIRAGIHDMLYNGDYDTTELDLQLNYLKQIAVAEEAIYKIDEVIKEVNDYVKNDKENSN